MGRWAWVTPEGFAPARLGLIEIDVTTAGPRRPIGRGSRVSCLREEQNACRLRLTRRLEAGFVLPFAEAAGRGR
jgi:hypothetical protein